jgi:putative NIF3 family GTP cyclohydrolase 1 type 2
MIKVAQSINCKYFVENDIININMPIQLGLWQYKYFKEYNDIIINKIKEHSIEVEVAHLPLDVLKQTKKDILNMIQFIKTETGCDHYVIHPNFGIREFLSDLKPQFHLCIENFQWKRKKIFRTPLDIIENLDRDKLWMTLDTSHADDVWFDFRILPFILKYTKIIHLSNRNKRSQHLPFNSQEGELNLVPFVRNLKFLYNWEGIIVLEYMPEYSSKIFKNAQYIKRILEV